jgi:hypothetical protein
MFTIAKPKEFRWEPQEDITAYELARCVPAFSISGNSCEKFIDNLPPTARRHFVEVQGKFA